MKFSIKKKIPACLIKISEIWPEKLFINFFWPYLDCFETIYNSAEYSDYWLHERVTWEIVTPRKRNFNVNLSFASVDIVFLGVTISHVTLSCSQYLYENSYVTLRNQLVHTKCRYITITCVCSAYLLARVRDPTSKENRVNKMRNIQAVCSVFVDFVFI